MPRFEPEKILRILVENEVEFLLIGGVAATLYGSNLRTGDVDICPRRTRANLARLSAALRALAARVRADGAPGGIPFDPHPELLQRMQMLNLSTRHGDFDLVFRPPGSGGFDELWPRRVTFDLDGLEVPVAALTDLIRTKEATGRRKDLDQLPTLRALLDETADPAE